MHHCWPGHTSDNDPSWFSQLRVSQGQRPSGTGRGGNAYEAVKAVTDKKTEEV